MRRKTSVKSAKGRAISSTKWLHRHINDEYVVLARKHSYKSRAAFKLLEINEKFKILSPTLGPRKDLAVVDLGCAPGSWLQILDEKLKGWKVIGVDLKDMSDAKISDTIVLQGDFTEKTIVEAICEKLGDSELSVILSDIATNSCGDKSTDHIRLAGISEGILDFAEERLAQGGNSVIKMIQGNLSQDIGKRAKQIFHSVRWFKPKASYTDSAEIYLIMYNKR